MPDQITVSLHVGANELTTRSYTNSCSPMWILAGVDLQDLDGQRALNEVANLQSAVDDMTTNPTDYEALNPADQSGDYTGCLAFMTELVGDCNAHPKAFIHVAVTPA